METSETGGARDSLLIQFTISVAHMIVLPLSTRESAQTYTHTETRRRSYTEGLLSNAVINK